MKKICSLLVCCVVWFVGTAAAVHIIPDHLGDSHFTSGPCPNIKPLDGAACPNGADSCAAFYNPKLLPPGYNSVAYCSTVLAGTGFGAPGFTMMTMPLNAQEQAAFLKAAQKLESYAKDNITVVVEPYKVAFLDSNGNNNVFFLGTEFWNPVCAADAWLPPFSKNSPTIIQNPDGSYSYKNFPETYSVVLTALQAKNAANVSPMPAINFLPSQSQINVEWPTTFFGWQGSTDMGIFNLKRFLIGTSKNYPITPGAKPFTLCDSPSAMKMLGFAPYFRKNGYTIDDINAPRNNPFVTLPGEDSALLIPDLTNFPPPSSPPYAWIYDSSDPSVVSTQLPKAFYEKSANFWLPQLSCADPTQCVFPQGFNGGSDLIAAFNHELHHILGVMSSQYYKVPYEGTAIAYTYGTALYLLDLFDLDSDFVVSGYGHPGIQSYVDFTSAPRNHNPNEPSTITYAQTASGLSPWIQFGNHDHLMTYDVSDGTPQYFPLMNNTLGNPDGDIQAQRGYVYSYSPNVLTPVFVDPILTNLSEMNIVPFNVQATSFRGTISVDTIREYSELAAQGWSIDYSTLSDPYNTTSPVSQWYQTCFDANGVFTTAINTNCKFSVTAQDLAFLSQ